jgi:hypothetical protein
LARKQFFRLDKFKGLSLEGVLRKTLKSLDLTDTLIEKPTDLGDDVAHDHRDSLTVSEGESFCFVYALQNRKYRFSYFMRSRIAS